MSLDVVEDIMSYKYEEYKFLEVIAPTLEPLQSKHIPPPPQAHAPLVIGGPLPRISSKLEGTRIACDNMKDKK